MLVVYKYNCGDFQ